MIRVLMLETFSQNQFFLAHANYRPLYTICYPGGKLPNLPVEGVAFRNTLSL